MKGKGSYPLGTKPDDSSADPNSTDPVGKEDGGGGDRSSDCSEVQEVPRHVIVQPLV